MVRPPRGAAAERRHGFVDLSADDDRAVAAADAARTRSAARQELIQLPVAAATAAANARGLGRGDADRGDFRRIDLDGRMGTEALADTLPPPDAAQPLVGANCRGTNHRAAGTLRVAAGNRPVGRVRRTGNGPHRNGPGTQIDSLRAGTRNSAAAGIGAAYSSFTVMRSVNSTAQGPHHATASDHIVAGQRIPFTPRGAAGVARIAARNTAARRMLQGDPLADIQRTGYSAGMGRCSAAARERRALGDFRGCGKMCDQLRLGPRQSASLAGNEAGTAVFQLRGDCPPRRRGRLSQTAEKVRVRRSGCGLPPLRRSSRPPPTAGPCRHRRSRRARREKRRTVAGVLDAAGRDRGTERGMRHIRLLYRGSDDGFQPAGRLAAAGVGSLGQHPGIRNNSRWLWHTIALGTLDRLAWLRNLAGRFLARRSLGILRGLRGKPGDDAG